jgi:predicted acylesterase/phospholipase RssA
MEMAVTRWSRTRLARFPVVRIVSSFLAALAVWGVESLVGAGYYVRDVYCIVAAGLLTLWLQGEVSRYIAARGEGNAKVIPCSNRHFIVSLAGALLLAWFFVSGLDILSRPGAIGLTPASGGRDGNERTVSQPKIGLCLSGGGFRAALFHAGVLSELDRQRIHAQVISSVSGGSIIAAFYARGGKPAEFLRAVKAGCFNVKRELLNCFTLIRLLKSAEFTRTDVQANMIDRLFLVGSKHIAPTDNAPELMICTTDILGATLLGITPAGVVTQRINSAIERTNFVNNGFGYGKPSIPEFRADTELPGEFRLSQLVAASGAFPAAFVPLTVGSDSNVRVLADGGIADNLGFVLPQCLNQIAKGHGITVPVDDDEDDEDDEGPEYEPPNLSNWEVDLLIVSDGSTVGKGSVPRSEIAVIGSAIDTMYLATGGEPIIGKWDDKEKLLPAFMVSPQGIRDLFLGVEWVILRDGETGLPSIITFVEMEAETLEFIIGHMPAAERRRANDALDAARAIGIYTNGRWCEPYFSPEAPAGVLVELVRGELNRRLQAFADTSTLVDQVDGESADSIFVLGQYMARLNLPFLRMQFARINRDRAAPASTNQ